MKVSVVVCTYAMDRYPAFAEAVESVLAQTYEPLEVVIVVDGNPEVARRAREEFGDEPTVAVHDNDENRGISYSRTRGAELADGEIVAMIDDDAVAEPDWVEQLVAVYEATDAIAVGGDVRPEWQTERPAFFPEEFYWLVGCVEPGFAEDGEEVRNVYGSNISYRREAFLAVDGYDPNTGRKGDSQIQAHEAPVGIRLREEFGRGMIYAADALVHHKLFEYRGEFGWLVRRSFWQGYSKRVMATLYPDHSGDEWTYLRELFLGRVPDRLAGLFRAPSLSGLLQLVSIVVFTAAVGLGYLFAMLRPGSLGRTVVEDRDG